MGRERPCGKSAFLLASPAIAGSERVRERGVRQSGVFLASPVTGAKSTTEQ